MPIGVPPRLRLHGVPGDRGRPGKGPPAACRHPRCGGRGDRRHPAPRARGRRPDPAPVADDSPQDAQGLDRPQGRGWHPSGRHLPRPPGAHFQCPRQQSAGRLRLRAVTSISEMLTAEDREAMSAAFGVPVINMFVSTEGLAGHSEPGGGVCTFASDHLHRRVRRRRRPPCLRRHGVGARRRRYGRRRRQPGRDRAGGNGRAKPAPGRRHPAERHHQPRSGDRPRSQDRQGQARPEYGRNGPWV
jgi:hypothetical protein